MSPRSLRRAAERKAAKLARKTEKQSAGKQLGNSAPQTPDLASSLDEFSPEFMAHAMSVADRIARKAGLVPHSSRSQNTAAPPKSRVDEPAPSSMPMTRREINRANAAHSTGPRSSTGKLASSRNSLKHGLASSQLIIPGEDPTAFETLRDALLTEHEPANTTEEMLIHEMAQSYWLTQRALRLQNDCFTPDGIDEKRLSLFLRYQTTHERAFHKALNTLVRLQKDRRRESRGFVSQKATNSPTASQFVRQNGHPEDQNSGFVSQNAPPPLTSEAA